MDKNTIFRFVIILVTLFVLIPNLIECRGGRGGSSSSGGGGSRSSSYSSRSYSGSSYYSYSRTYSPVLLYSYSYYGYNTGYVGLDRSESQNNALAYFLTALFFILFIKIMVLKIIVVQTGRTCKQACCCIYCCECEKPEIDETELKNDCTDQDAS